MIKTMSVHLLLECTQFLSLESNWYDFSRVCDEYAHVHLFILHV